MVLEQWAYGELANYTMGSSTINEYITHFKHLLQKAGWDRTLRGSLFQFKGGLKQKIHLRIMQKEPMPNKMLDMWEEAACKEVKQQAFIDASLRPREFQGTWGAKRDPRGISKVDRSKGSHIPT